VLNPSWTSQASYGDVCTTSAHMDLPVSSVECAMCQVDPGGSQFPPTLSNWLKIVLWQLTIFSIFFASELLGPF
jgi:hypothetical protein